MVQLMGNYSEFLDAKKLFYSGEYNKALPKFISLLDDEDFNCEAVIYLAKIYKHLNRYEDFENLLISFLYEVPKNEAEVLDTLFDYYYTNKMYDKIKKINNDYKIEIYLPKEVERILHKYKNLIEEENLENDINIVDVFKSIDDEYASILEQFFNSPKSSKEIIENYLLREDIEKFYKYALLFIIKDYGINWEIKYCNNNIIYNISIDELVPIEEFDVYKETLLEVNKYIENKYPSLLGQVSTILQDTLINLFPSFTYKVSLLTSIVIWKIFEINSVDLNINELCKAFKISSYELEQLNALCVK